MKDFNVVLAIIKILMRGFSSVIIEKMNAKSYNPLNLSDIIKQKDHHRNMMIYASHLIVLVTVALLCLALK